MEPKKYMQYDVGRKSGLFFNIGLALSILFVITAFEWKFYDSEGFVSFNNENQTIDELIDIPPTVQPPPVVPIQQPQVVEVPDEEEIPEELLVDFDSEIKVDDVIEEIVYVAPPEEKTEEIVDFPEVEAEPLNGFEEYYKALGKSLKYPRVAQNLHIEGTVFVQFVVDKDGNVSDVQLLKGIGAGCDEEAIRVIKEGPKWKPGRVRAQPVISRRRIPIRFKLD